MVVVGPGGAPQVQGTPSTATGEFLDPCCAASLAVGIEPFFTENQGQLADEDVRFFAQGDPLSVGFGPGWMAYVVHGSGVREPLVLRVQYDGCHPREPEASGLLPHPTSYLIGVDEDDWVVGSRSYRSVHYDKLYDGVDLAFYFRDGSLKYDLVVGPRQDPSVVRMTYVGAEALSLEEGTGDLIINTPGRTLREDAPRAFQLVGGTRLGVDARFYLEGGRTLGFELGGFDDDLPLVIDPGLAFSTFLGGGEEDEGNGMAVDGNESAYVVGETDSTKFPTKAGSYDTTYNGGQSDAFVVKLKADGSGIEYATFVGGGNTDVAWDVVVDSKGCAYVTGMCGSGFPTTKGAWDRTNNGGQDTFVLKLNATGTGLVYSTLLGGSKGDEAYGIAIDGSGNAYVTGNTGSKDFPVTTGAFDRYYNGREGSDGFVVKLNHNGSKANYSTYIGGSDNEYLRDLQVDASGQVFITGFTASSDYPTTSGAYHETMYVSKTAVVVSKFDANGSKLLYSTFVNGKSRNFAHGIAVDTSGNAYVAGYTNDGMFPTTPGAYDRSKAGANTEYDAYLLKLNPKGSDLVYSTFLGGKGGEKGKDVAIDGDGQAYVFGHTVSDDFPTTPDAFCGTHSAYGDLFLTKFNPAGSDVLYSTYIGAKKGDLAEEVVVSDKGLAYLVGTSQSPGFPITKGAYDTSHNDDDDVIAVKLDVEPPFTWGGVMDPFATTGDPFNISIRARDNWGVERIEVEYCHGDPSAQGGPPPDWQNMTLVEGTEANGTWNVTIHAWNNSIEPLNTTLHVYDKGGLRHTVALASTPVYDNDAPGLQDLTSGPGTTGDVLAVTLDVTDNIAVNRTRVLHWWGGASGSAVNETMEPLATSGLGNGTYVLNVTVPTSTLLPLRYRLGANDTSGNWNWTEVIEVEVFDDDPPAIMVEGSYESATTGQALAVNVTIRDNIGVAVVWVSAWRGSGQGSFRQNLSMSATGTDAWGNGSYSGTVEVVASTLLGLNFLVGALDSGGNQALTRRYTVNVTDDDVPIFWRDLTPSEATTGDPLTFVANVTDNIELDTAWVMYWYGRDRPENVSLELVPTESQWVATVPVMHTHHELRYILYARDISGNSNWTRQREVRVVDNDPPEVLGDLTADFATTGDPFELVLETSDNLGVVNATLTYRFGEEKASTIDLPSDVQGGTGTWTFTKTLEIPSNSLLPLSYGFEVTDTTGNTNGTVETTVEVLDDDPPSFGEDLTPAEVVGGLELVTFRIVVLDNIAVVAVHMHEGHDGNGTELVQDGEEWCVTIDYSQRGQGVGRGQRPSPSRWPYSFRAVDAAGNVAITEVRYVSEVNAPPSFLEVPVWRVVEEEPSELDLAEHLAGVYDPWDRRSLECNDSDVEVEGLRLKAMFDTWVPDQVLEVTVSDGCGTAIASITLTVVNVNDAPEITTVSVGVLTIGEERATVGRDQGVTAEAQDEDGDELTFTWKLGGEVVGTGPALRHDDLPAGEHDLTLVVTDGVDETTRVVRLTVEEVPRGKAFPGTTLVLLMIIAVVTVLVLLGVRRLRSGLGREDGL